MPGVAFLALAPQGGTSFVTVHCKAVWAHTGKFFLKFTHALQTCGYTEQQQTSLLIGWDGEGAGTWLAGVEPAQVRSQDVAVFTHLTEISCAVVLAVLAGEMLNSRHHLFACVPE